MPSIKDESTVEAIARAFTSNGRCKGKALITVGYADSYAIDGGRGCDVVFSNVRVKAAIARIDAKTAKKADYSIEKYRQELDEARTHARELRQPSAEVSAIVAKGRSCGYDKDNDMGSKDQPQPITAAQAEEWRLMAQAATRASLGPKLSKEAV